MKNEGGLCLKDYYISAHPKISYSWCNHDYQARWKEIEEKVSGAVPSQAHLGDKRLIKNLMEGGNTWINLSLKIWLKVINKNNLLEEIKILNWCSHDLDFISYKLDVSYKGWAHRGLSAYCTLFNQGTLSDFRH